MSNTESTQSRIDRNKANLPLPDQPPVASDWNSMDATNVNVGSGRVESHTGTGPHASAGLREPPPAGMGSAEENLGALGREGKGNLGEIGREGKENLSGPPKDAKY